MLETLLVTFTVFMVEACRDMEYPFGNGMLSLPGLNYTTSAALRSLTIAAPPGDADTPTGSAAESSSSAHAGRDGDEDEATLSPAQQLQNVDRNELLAEAWWPSARDNATDQGKTGRSIAVTDPTLNADDDDDDCEA